MHARASAELRLRPAVRDEADRAIEVQGMVVGGHFQTSDALAGQLLDQPTQERSRHPASLPRRMREQIVELGDMRGGKSAAG